MTGRDLALFLVVLFLMLSVVLGRYVSACFYLVTAVVSMNLMQTLLPGDEKPMKDRM